MKLVDSDHMFAGHGTALPYREPGTSAGSSVNPLGMFSPEHLKLRRDVLLAPAPKRVNTNPKLERLGWIDRWLCRRLTKHVCNNIVVGKEHLALQDDLGIVHHMLLTLQKSGWDVVYPKYQTAENLPYSTEYVRNIEDLVDCKNVLVELVANLDWKKIVVKLKLP